MDFKKIIIIVFVFANLVYAENIIDKSDNIKDQYQQIKTINVGFMYADAPVTYNLDGKRYGIAYDLFQNIADKLKLNVNYINYDSHKDAISDLSSGKLSVLLGGFVHDASYEEKNIIHSPVFFVDEDIIVGPKETLSFASVLAMMWTDLLKNTILFSVAVSVFVWLLLLIFEGRKHDDVKKMKFFEKLSYMFFQVWACFLRDLIYNPATNAGRIIMSAWMFFSILMITVVTSILTSTIIILNTDSVSPIKSSRELHFKDVGYLSGHHSSHFAISLLGGHAKEYDGYDEFLTGVAKKDVDHGVLGKTDLYDYLSKHSNFKDLIVVTNLAVSYEGWVLLYNKNDKIYSDINRELVHFVEAGNLYPICSKYISHPEHCLVM